MGIITTSKPANKSRYLSAYHNGVAVTSVTATAGRVVLILFEVPFDCKVDAIIVQNVATVAGNATVGIYGPIAFATDTCLDAPLLIESASTALSGASQPQIITFTETDLIAGKYYMAVEYSDATHTYLRQANSSQVVGWGQYYDRGGGYGALTNPCPAVTNTGTALPGLRVRISS